MRGGGSSSGATRRRGRARECRNAGFVNGVLHQHAVMEPHYAVRHAGYGIVVRHHYDRAAVFAAVHALHQVEYLQGGLEVQGPGGLIA